MAPINDILAFCPTDTGTNLETQSDYLADTNRISGQKPGVASSKLNNKALRQTSYIASQLAQYLANQSNTDVLDAATPSTLLAQMMGVLGSIPTYYDSFATVGSSTFNTRYAFIVSAASASVGATYTNNGVTFTVMRTVTTGTLIYLSGSSAPSASGTLTKASGTGDAAITFIMVRAPVSIKLKLVGGGGGGSGNGQSASGGAGGTGGTTSFGTSLLTAPGGTGGQEGAAGQGGGGGVPVVNSPATPLAVIVGGSGTAGGLSSSTSTAAVSGGTGAPSPFGGGGGGSGFNSGTGNDAADNSGAGGGGAATANAVGTVNSGGGGGAGGYIEANIDSPGPTYPFTVGAAGIAGTAGTNGSAGGKGGTGLLIVASKY
jgi:hypothetical protein